MNKIRSSTLQVILRVFSVILILANTNLNAAELENLPDPLDAGWEGKKVCVKLSENDVNRVLRCTFPPGIGHERHYHISHFGYAISGGRVRLVDSKGAREVNLATGSYYSSRGVEWHHILNIGNTTVIYLIVEEKRPPQK
jgi:hypothetical protein